MTVKAQKNILVTGASGFLGKRVVACLLQNGHKVRAFVRDTSDTTPLRKLGVDIAIGDVVEFDSLERAFDGIDVVVHAAADTAGTDEGGQNVTVGGTNNVIQLCRKFATQKLIYISSCSVYGIADLHDGQVVDENSALESRPKQRGAYTDYKLQAENAVRASMDRDEFPVVCLRPGAIYGPGTALFSPMLGFSAADKIFVVIGLGGLIPPWTHVDNVAAAVCVSVDNDAANGQIFNVVDPERIPKKHYINRLVRRLHPDSWFFYVPYFLILIVTILQEGLFKMLRRTPFLTRYRLVSSQRPVVFDGSKISREIRWQPSVSFEQAVDGWDAD